MHVFFWIQFIFIPWGLEGPRLSNQFAKEYLFILLWSCHLPTADYAFSPSNLDRLHHRFKMRVLFSWLGKPFHGKSNYEESVICFQFSGELLCTKMQMLYWVCRAAINHLEIFCLRSVWTASQQSLRWIVWISMRDTSRGELPVKSHHFHNICFHCNRNFCLIRVH